MLPWSVGTGGVVDLDEPLSIEELQSGAFVLRVSRNGAPAVDAVGVPVFRTGGELDRLEIYAYGIVIGTAAASGEGLLLGHYVVQLTDHSAEWRVVGVRLDRQYWHGGSLSWVSTFIPGDMGESSYVRLRSGSDYFALAVSSDRPSGGLITSGGRLCIYSGQNTLSDGIMCDTYSGITDLPLVKGVLIYRGNTQDTVIRVLYPYQATNQTFDMAVYTEDGGVVTLDTAGPYYIEEVG